MFNLDPLIKHLMIFRSCHFAGYYGAGKSALSVECAIRLVVDGHVKRIVSNIPLAFESSGTVDVANLIDVEDSAIIMDEAWNFLSAGEFKRAKEFLAYPRHQNQVLLFPSVTNLTSYVQWLQVRRVWSGLKVGIPCWLYRMDIEPKDFKGKKPPRGRRHYIYWWNPQSVFGLYTHTYRENKLNPRLFHVYEGV